MNAIRLTVAALAAVGSGLFLVGCEPNDMHMALERPDAVTLHGKPLTLIGPELKVGQVAPAFDAVANDMSMFHFTPAGRNVRILVSVPSLDTSVCGRETRQFNEEAAKLGGKVEVIAVSMDLPFAQKRWCAAEGVKHVTTVSDYRFRQFGPRYGVLIKQNALLARAVFVVNKDGRITYIQLVPEETHLPDFNAALSAAKTAAGIQK